MISLPVLSVFRKPTCARLSENVCIQKCLFFFLCVTGVLTHLTLMAKRLAEHSLQHDLPPKRHRRSLLCVDAQLESMAPAGGVPSILALLGGRSRKRPCCFDDVEMPGREAATHLKAAVCLSKKRNAADNLMEPISGSLQDRRRTCLFTNKKRPREDCVASYNVLPTPNTVTETDDHPEDCIYNSFQYWRVPLPELDLSLLGDSSDHSQTEEKLKVSDSPSDVMET